MYVYTEVYRKEGRFRFFLFGGRKSQFFFPLYYDKKLALDITRYEEKKF